MELTGRVIRVLREDGFDLGFPLFGPDGDLLATASSPFVDGKELAVRISDWRKGGVEATIPTAADIWPSFVFDPAGTSLATYSDLGQPDIWDVRTGELVANPSRQPGDLYGLAFSPDGSLLATASIDWTVRLFDARSGLLRLTLHGPAGRLAFSPDGSMLATKTEDGARVWALDINDLLEIAHQNVTRSLTDEECRQYLHVERCPSG